MTTKILNITQSQTIALDECLEQLTDAFSNVHCADIETLSKMVLNSSPADLARALEIQNSYVRSKLAFASIQGKLSGLGLDEVLSAFDERAVA